MPAIRHLHVDYSGYNSVLPFDVQAAAYRYFNVTKALPPVSLQLDLNLLSGFSLLFYFITIVMLLVSFVMSNSNHQPLSARLQVGSHNSTRFHRMALDPARHAVGRIPPRGLDWGEVVLVGALGR